MINFSIPFQTYNKAELLEQAAGFPPFTRGYTTVAKNIVLTSFKKSNYTLSNLNDESIHNLFKEIIADKPIGTITLNINFEGIISNVITVRVLRTLLAFTSDNLYNNPSIIQFEFFGVYQSNSTSLNTLFYANAAQLDFLTVSNKDNWEPLTTMITKTPIDNLYGSSYLKEKTSTVFFRLWTLVSKDLQ